MRIEFDPSLGRLDGDTDPGLMAHKPYLQLKAIHRLATAVTQAATLDEIFEAAIQGLVSALAITRAAILTWGEDGRMHFRVWRNLSEEYRKVTDGHSPWQRDVIEPEPILMADPLREPLSEALQAVIRSEGIHGLAFIPLLYKGRLLGKLMVYADHPGAIHPDAVQLAQTLAGHVAFALGRKQAEEEHRATEMRLTRILRSMPVILYDAEVPHPAAATWVSDNAGGIVGYSVEELLTIPDLWDQHLHPDDRADYYKALELCRTAGSAIAEYRWQRKDGIWIYLLDHMERVETQADGRIHMVGVLTDISEQKLREETQRESQKLEGIGLLAGGIAHDFNNLLTAMTGNLNLAQMKLPPDSPVQIHLGNLESILERTADLTRQMLAYSGRGKLHVAKVDLNHTVQDMTALLRVSISSQAQLLVKPTPRLPLILADAAQIHQVVMNLITNASEAIGDKEGTITLSTRLERVTAASLPPSPPSPRMAPGDYVVLEVGDTGCGIPPETILRIFEPFFTTKATGRGLGMSALLGILRAHQGGVRVASRPSGGTTVTIYFPTDSVPEAPVADADRAQVLVVDDEPMILMNASELIEGLGLNVVTARNGREALERIQESASGFALVIMDQIMPGVDGRTTARLIHQFDPKLPVVLSSGFSLETSELGEGVVGFLPKPYSLAQLRRLLSQYGLA
ncbi:MAG: response regulator [Holophagaceae bacterium]|uniref:histidine kinase n=1 Tax=Candidatus Geothrix skivensis TaxID=2954439 RepID=A0A9D7SF81_9BACT|nr:response regulator [Candidatus Geothrix skivensis]